MIVVKKYLTEYALVCYNKSKSSDNLHVDTIHGRHERAISLLVCYSGKEILDRNISDVL